MLKSEKKSWKKVKIEDYDYIANEIKDMVDMPVVIFLEGDLGAGKTTFSNSFTSNQTSSPTYSIVNEYDDMVHADFYRLKTSEELYDLELSIYLDNKFYFLAEWGIQYIDELHSSHIPDGFYYYLLEFSNSSADSKQRNLKFYEINPLI